MYFHLPLNCPVVHATFASLRTKQNAAFVVEFQVEATLNGEQFRSTCCYF